VPSDLIENIQGSDNFACMAKCKLETLAGALRTFQATDAGNELTLALTDLEPQAVVSIQRNFSSMTVSQFEATALFSVAHMCPKGGTGVFTERSDSDCSDRSDSNSFGLFSECFVINVDCFFQRRLIELLPHSWRHV